ncbi:RNA-binding domain-containing protein [Marinicrinis sediminis]|uniref:RNA-binding domain-containing protein n=1 Tax=Marinicrinis sediminis TaxID=1652465 RepID=A0ABW5R8S0_9BACL
MNIDECMRLIQNGESSHVEFKEEGIKPTELAEEIVAFSNADGGTIIIGVSDKGEIIGITNRRIEEWIINICRDGCIPQVHPHVQVLDMSGKEIALISIPKGLNKPYYTGNHKYYIRVGTTKRIASKEELMRLFEASGYFHYDISPVPGTSVKDISIELVREYYMQYNMFDLYEESESSIQRILINADILRETDQGVQCTVGGLLVFGKSPVNKLPQSGISFAHFNGEDITEELIDKKQVNGRLNDIAEQIMTILKNNMLTGSVIKGAKREEVEDYPILVLREAVVNALVHRNYSITGSKIRVLMYADRIEFHSPGRLPNTVNVEKMKVGISYARNPFLVKYMENMRYIDQLGRGIPMILKSMMSKGAREPELEETGEEFVLTIYKP